MLDTEDADSAAERFWPEDYKQVIRVDLRQSVGAKIGNGKRLRHMFQRFYSREYRDLSEFINKIADMIAIGAENGADDAFDEIITAFLSESPLPEVLGYARYFWPQTFPQRVKKRLQQVIVGEYRQDNIYQHAYDSYYQRSFRSFDEFIARVALTVVTAAVNGADDMLEVIYRSFMTPYPLPTARRYPRRVKLWAPAGDSPSPPPLSQTRDALERRN